MDNRVADTENDISDIKDALDKLREQLAGMGKRVEKVEVRCDTLKNLAGGARNSGGDGLSK